LLWSALTAHLETGIHMSELRNNASSIAPAFHHGNRGAELAAHADLVLARYPAYIREEITDLLRVLAEKPRDPVKGVR
jgi:hypothetical protein